jgi:hypothetical protein
VHQNELCQPLSIIAAVDLFEFSHQANTKVASP